MKDKELAMQSEHNEEFIERIDEEAEKMAEVYGSILQRLPNLERMVQVSARAGDVSDTVIEGDSE